MNLLLDTHVLIWNMAQKSKVGPKTRVEIETKENNISISSITTLEIAQLIYKGRLTVLISVQEIIKRSIEYLLAEECPLTHEIAIESYNLPEPFHNDPADRILAATARINDLTLLTADQRILNYPHLRTMDARL